MTHVGDAKRPEDHALGSTCLSSDRTSDRRKSEAHTGHRRAAQPLLVGECTDCGVSATLELNQSLCDAW